MAHTQQTLCVVGLGYVGLPLAYAFAKAGYEVLGYDISEKRITELRAGVDCTNELSPKELQSVSINFSSDPTIISGAHIVILAIPTPIDTKNNPDLTLLENASATVGKHLAKGAIVVYESTVYPGVTEEICGPILEEASGLTCGKDFTLGYSPERINPGDKEHTVETIVKIVAGQDEKTLETLAELYGSVVKAGIHQAPSIKVAEMAKAIENAQRDLNIAFVNEVAMLCGHLGIRTKDVLAAAATKWNFLNFKPGLVGGHCIGVDPYYLVEVARQHGMTTRVIAAGRATNDGMAVAVAKKVNEALHDKARGARIFVLGLTFKENIPDTRNSKSMDVTEALEKMGHVVEIDDPYVSDETLEKLGMKRGTLDDEKYDAILLLVPHKEFLAVSAKQYTDTLRPKGLFFDLKSVLDREAFEKAGKIYLAL